MALLHPERVSDRETRARIEQLRQDEKIPGEYFIERLAPSDVPQLRSDSRFKIAKIVELGYQGITINIGKSELAQKNPLGKDARVREAFELSIDREALVRVAMEGEAQAGALAIACNSSTDL